MNVYLYLDRDTILHRLDPRAKLIVLFGAFTLAFLFTSPVANLLILAFMLLIVTVAKAWPNIRRLAKLLVIIAIMTTIMFAITQPGDTPLIGFITEEGVIHGLAIGFRLDALIVAGLVFLSTTTNEEISIALVRLGISYRFAFAVSTALRLVPTVLGTAHVITQAQKCRGNDIESGNVFARIKRFAPVVIPVFVSTIRSTQVFGMALESKGFGVHKHRTYLLNPTFGGRDVVAAAAVLALLTSATLLRLSGVGMLASSGG